MFCNVLASSLRNLAGARLYAAISIGGLAVAFAAAILIGVFVRDDLQTDRFIPGFADVWRLSITLTAPGETEVEHMAVARSDLAAFLKADFPQVKSAARLVATRPLLRNGQVQAVDKVYWADRSVFEVLPLPVLAGDLKGALARPDSLVLTRRLARKYFGRDDPVGETLTLEPAPLPPQPGVARPAPAPHPMRVAAVLQDLPPDTHLDTEAFASGLATFSSLTAFDRLPKSFGPRVYTYVRLAPGASGAALAAAMPAFGARHIDPRPLLGGRMTPVLTALTHIHYLPPAYSDMKAPGNRTATLAIAGVGVLIVLIAAINFVSLMSARSGRRAIEVGVRKAAGARRSQLMLQFLGESLIYAALSLASATVLAELLAPAMSAIVGRPVRPDYLHDLGLVAAILGVTAAVGLLAGLYPALVLSSFRPGLVLKGGPVAAGGGAGLRRTLATLQFAVLIALLVAATVIWRQTAFALAKGLDNGADHLLLVSGDPSCPPLRDRVRRLAGVVQASCASNIAVTGGSAPTDVVTAGGHTASLQMAPLDFGLMELEGQAPLAGRFLSETHPEDGLLQSGTGGDKQPPVVINATAVRSLGFASPAAAVGQIVRWQRLNPSRKGVGDDLFPRRASQIVGVVPDFSMQTIRQPVPPMIYYVDPGITTSGYLAVRVSGQDAAATLRRISQQGPALGTRRPLQLEFYSQIAQALYDDIVHQSRAVAAGAAIAVFIACLGLFGLAANAAERRTKEIGVRKAMGASSGGIVLLLLTSFTPPVLWANLIAWPVSWWSMDRWLSGFAYRIPLSPWFFLAASAAALAIAAATVAAHAVRAARAKPVEALRYE
ncbi:MAG TPA: FtsX-like permease family protein [Caulobacteraceae bacterium]